MSGRLEDLLDYQDFKELDGLPLIGETMYGKIVIGYTLINKTEFYEYYELKFKDRLHYYKENVKIRR